MVDQTVHEIQRGYILRYLALAYPAVVTPLMVHYELRRGRYSSTDKNLTFQLHYLQEKGWVTLEDNDPQIGEEEKILTIKITAAGIDVVDRRRRGEEVKF